MKDKPFFLITSDIDWASESAIKFFLDEMIRYDIKPLLFITHYSQAVSHYYKNGLVDLGIHPNFNANSDHGKTPQDVVKFIKSLAPNAIISRSHCFLDEDFQRESIAAEGLKYDSNSLEFLRNNITTINLPQGIKRFPVYWSDGFAFRQSDKTRWSKTILHDSLFSQGLKILNVHPFNYSLNISDLDEYDRQKPLTKIVSDSHISKSFDKRTFGTRDMVRSIIETVQEQGFEFNTLNQLLEY